MSNEIVIILEIGLRANIAVDGDGENVKCV